MWMYKDSTDHPSIHETVCHMADTEALEYLYCRHFFALGGSPACEIDASAWSGNHGYFYSDIKTVMAAIRALRQVTYHFLKALPETAWSCTAEFPAYGRLTLDEWLELRENYFPEHIRRMERMYEVWCDGRSSLRTLPSGYKAVPVGSFAP
jgi:hypothetical protein